ncbi:uncharacterized protein LOC113236362, partial [Hyposmocoma kahamanoa]|uniref:uncharacterized protein LOC113236362 n=1 Tax=Hyposmocoma kahamanoa TaxID=1477025 RepID=UPI000E6D6662
MEIYAVTTGYRDIFVIIEKILRYTRTTEDVIVFLETIMKSTNSSNIRVATNKLKKLTNQKGLFEAIEVIYSIVRIDVITFFEAIITLSKRFRFDEVITIFEDYTEAKDFIESLRRLRAYTGEEDILKAIEHIKQNKPKKITMTTTTTTTTQKPLTAIERRLMRITGCHDMEQVQEVFKKVFGSS